MKNELLTSLVTVATAIVGVAILAVLVSKNANTSGVITSAGGAFASALNAATSPITGNSFSGGGVSAFTLQ